MSERWRRPRKIKGLGDVVSLIANPIAQGLDKLLKTNISGCGGCKKRQEKLNEIFPIKKDDTNE